MALPGEARGSRWKHGRRSQLVASESDAPFTECSLGRAGTRQEPDHRAHRKDTQPMAAALRGLQPAGVRYRIGVGDAYGALGRVDGRLAATGYQRHRVAGDVGAPQWVGGPAARRWWLYADGNGRCGGDPDTQAGGGGVPGGRVADAGSSLVGLALPITLQSKVAGSTMPAWRPIPW